MAELRQLPFDDARVDGLNWDLLNDGIANPKNSKSMLLTHRTPPAMSLGVRDTAETAVRAGLRSILFVVQPEEVPRTIDAYLKSLTPIPSPIVVSNAFAARIKAGEKIFNSTQAGCSTCTPRPLHRPATLRRRHPKPDRQARRSLRHPDPR